MNLGATSLAHETLHRRGQQAIPRRRALPIRLANSAEPCFASSRLPRDLMYPLAVPMQYPDLQCNLP